jgi:hypothetical protein
MNRLVRCWAVGWAIASLGCTADVDVKLAPAGGKGGAPFALACPAGLFATGMTVRTDELVDSVSLSCGRPGRDDTWSSSTVGGTNGSRVTKLHCFPGELLVGATGRAGAYNDALGIVCAAAATVRAGSTFVFEDPPVGGPGGQPWQRRCPAHLAVHAIEGRSGHNIDRLVIVCGRPSLD